MHKVYQIERSREITKFLQQNDKCVDKLNYFKQTIAYETDLSLFYIQLDTFRRKIHSIYLTNSKKQLSEPLRATNEKQNAKFRWGRRKSINKQFDLANSLETTVENTQRKVDKGKYKDFDNLHLNKLNLKIILIQERLYYSSQFPPPDQKHSFVRENLFAKFTSHLRLGTAQGLQWMGLQHCSSGCHCILPLNHVHDPFLGHQGRSDALRPQASKTR